MSEVFHERLKAPIPRRELDRRTAVLQQAMKQAGLDCIIAQNITQSLGGCNRWLTDTTAENNYPQSSILPCEGEVRYIACSGPPLDLYPPSHLLRIGKPYDAAPYFSPFNFTNDWEGMMAVNWIRENNAKRVGIAGLEMFYWNYYEYIVRQLPDVEVVDASEMFDHLRAIKSADELAFIRNSAKVQDKVMGYIPAFTHAGVREYELRAKLMQLVTDYGGEEMVIVMGSAPRGERFELMPSFFQNRTLQQGDQLYVRMSTSGPGGMFTTLGRMFSIDSEPSPQMQENWAKALEAQQYLTEKLVPGADPQVLFADYNRYLTQRGYRTEDGLFAYGQGYDNIERPSLQPGESMKLACDMSMAVHTSLVDNTSSIYCADSFLIGGDGARRLHKTPQILFRT